MKEIREIKTWTYDMGDGYRVDIVADYVKGEYDTWVYHTDYGQKIYMFGIVGMLSMSYEELIRIAEIEHYDYREKCIC